MPWTREQQSAIDIRGKSILVSAAAGSGKTAVLVERIINRVLDKENPVDIDEFLVVTFTKAAAAQMREKISDRLWSELEKTPDNEHLMRQTILINRADITTIDSFCLRIVKEYFNVLDIDADFNIGDRGETELLKADVLEDLFEEKYNCENEKERVEFCRLVSIFGGDRDDSGLRELILKIHTLASSYPMPEKWLEEARTVLDIKEKEALEHTLWMKELFGYAKKVINEALFMAREAETLTNAACGPYKNAEVSKSDIELLEELADVKSYEELGNAVKNISWQRLKSCKGDEFDEALVNRFAKIRGDYKKLIKKLDICKTPCEEILIQLNSMGEYLLPLIEIVEAFSLRYMEEKKQRHIVEFADVEHMAYRLVCEGIEKDKDDAGRETEAVIPTEIGREIGEKYREIYIDEYQDSNYLQEYILTAVSGIARGENNLFMVGDVKQSIYKFRMARPDLFIGKYNTFPPYDGENDAGRVKLELKNNFRSRAVVLDAVNYFFYQLMGADMGGIDYTEAVALVPARQFEDADDLNISRSTELMLACMTDKERTDDDDEVQEESKQELEAMMIANRIDELVNSAQPLYVYDEKISKYRNACYGDIVILLRSVSGYGDIIYNTLTAQGIPAYIDDPQGYFEATEIRVVMSLLAVIDNSRQDIPLSAALLSPIAGLNENELVRICSYAEKNLDGKTILYDKCLYYAETVSDGTADKLNTFFAMVDMLKEEKTTLSISQLILKVYDITGYYHYAAAMPAGKRRKSNLDMLVDKARRFENGVYKGLFNFLRYVDKLKINEVDFGEAGKQGEDENVVRIMTMHRSKGLEYPIVFVSGLGRQFNTNDVRRNIQLHSDYYISSKLIDMEKRYRKNSVMREAVILLAKQESFAEEQRILYVAMTRAKEKLILTGYIKDYEDTIEGLDIGYEKMLLPYSIRNSGKGFLNWITASMKRYDYYLKKGLTKAVIETKLVSPEQLLARKVKEETDKGIGIEEFIENAMLYGENEAYKKFKESFDYVYPYEALTKIKSKMPISEIKKMKAFDGEHYDVEEYPVTVGQKKSDKEEICKQGEYTAGSEKSLTGAERGTIVHKFMELLDFASLGAGDYMQDIRNLLQRLVEAGVFTEEEKGAINEAKINSMLKSDLGQRMIAAAKCGRLKKEQQFSIGIPVKEIYKNIDSDDIVIVQGIIDAFFYEDDKIVLMDYKTDRADEAELIGRYHAQLTYYALTLTRLIGLKVEEKLIYSFYLNKTIEVKEE
ncbi:MAG: helicase-exonuclease AddAB subunit AddA [Clostridium sp.]|nr:helicase-exonuclease AddAB subunit AddA [Clostridium sp.]